MSSSRFVTDGSGSSWSPDRAKTAAAEVVTGAAPRSRLLLVDDDPGGRFILASLLGEEGYQVACAGSLKEAEAALEAGKPYHLVVLDLHLTDGLGTDLLPRVRHRLPRARVVLLSGDVSGAGDAVPPGFDACLPKALDFAETLASIRRLLAPAR
jgi:DNA-binding NtrC family response regulator